jgi:enoyl-CoA hydratase
MTSRDARAATPVRDEAAVIDDGAVGLTMDGEVATIIVDRVAKLNALTRAMLERLEEVIREVGVGDARVVLVRAAPAKAFCVGADINEFADLSASEIWRDWTTRGHRVFGALAGLPQPTVAVLHGHALGGGLELALACDFRVLATGARLGFPEVGIGTVPGWGGTERLTRLVGPSRAKEIILAGRQLDGETALAWGVATSVAPDAALDATVADLVTRILAGAPTAVQIAKQLIDATADGVPSRVIEPLAGALTATTADLAEGVAAFRERRNPTFPGR